MDARDEAALAGLAVRAPWPAAYAGSTAARLEWVERVGSAGAVNPTLRRWARAAVEGYALAGVALAPADAILRAQVRSIAWRPDPGLDHYQSPLWTYLHGAGDCNATVALYLALCRSVGIACRAAWRAQPGSPLDHVFALAADRRGALEPAETTLATAVLGQDPDEAAAQARAEGRLLPGRGPGRL